MKTINVGIIGATGIVGQRILSLLDEHPYFNLVKLYGRTFNKPFCEIVNWKLESKIPQKFKNILVNDIYNLKTYEGVDLIFSALPADVAYDLEPKLRAMGKIIVSNASAFRLDEEVSLAVPELSIDFAKNISFQKEKYNGGFIITNPNCSVLGLSLGFYPIQKNFGIESIEAVTLQAVSGAGINGVGSMDILGNVIPYIKNEEEKMEAEYKKITNDTNVIVRARVNRVPVLNGHTINVFFKTKKSCTCEELLNAYNSFEPVCGKIHSIKDFSIYNICDALDSPQPLKHAWVGEGFTTSIGRIKQYSEKEFSLVILSNNIIRGAAGGTLLVAEALLENKLI